MNKATALELLALIGVAYAQKAGKPAALPVGLHLEMVETLTVHENFKQVPFGFVAKDQSPSGDMIAYVVLRGTTSLLEWFQDGFVVPHAVALCGATTQLNTTDGYESIYRQLSPQIVKALRAIQPTGVVVTGHSLGGALALLAVVDIWNNLQLRAESYTFGAPRVGDPGFAAAFAAQGFKAWRVFNTEDIVPTLPPATTDLSATIESPSDWLLSLFARVKGLYQHVGTPVPLTYNLGSLEANHGVEQLADAIGRDL